MRLCCVVVLFSGILIPMVVDICKGYKSPLTGHWAVFRYGKCYCATTSTMKWWFSSHALSWGIFKTLNGWLLFCIRGQSPPKRKVFRFHETILSFGEPGSLGIHIQARSGLDLPETRTRRMTIGIGVLLGVKHFCTKNTVKNLLELY